MVQIALFVAVIISFFLGLFVFLNNARSKLFRVYFSLNCSSALWILVNGLVVNHPVTLSSGLLLFASRLITPLSLITTINFTYFMVLFKQIKLMRQQWILVLPSVVVSAFSFTDLNVYLTSGSTTSTGALYPLYLLVLLFNVGLVFWAVHKRSAYSSAKSLKSQQQQAQLKYLQIGTYATFIPAVGFGALLPIVSNSELSDLGPLFSLIFLAAAAMAIIKHRLFDVRAVVARSLAYTLSLSLLAVLFGLTSYVITLFVTTKVVFDNNELRIIYSILAVGLALLFPTIKLFFDRITKRIFYQDSYDAQLFLDKFNKILVSTYDLPILLERSAEIIAANLKSSYVVFGINNTPTAAQKTIGTRDHPMFSAQDIDFVKAFTPHMRKKIIITDDLGDRFLDLQTALQANRIAVLARITLSSMHGDVGYLALGPKKNGNIYSRQDIKVIEILANELVIAIQNAMRFEEIENFTVNLQERIDDATRKLRRSNQKLRELDDAKDDFVSMASHQLRTPLTSVKGYISMVLEGDAGPINATQRKLLEQSFISSQRMVYLIADLLNVSRLKTGKFIIEQGPVNLADVVEQEIGQLQEVAAGRQLSLTYERPASFPTLLLDETKTRQVIMNFVDNAIYYTPSGGSIEVKLVETPASVELRVVDNGIGVPKSEQPHLFTKFYRAGNARKARPDGTGLGLFMAKKVIVSEGGAIIFETQENQGSTFGFMFPKTKMVATTPSVAPTEAVVAASK